MLSKTFSFVLLKCCGYSWSFALPFEFLNQLINVKNQKNPPNQETIVIFTRIALKVLINLGGIVIFNFVIIYYYLSLLTNEMIYPLFILVFFHFSLYYYIVHDFPCRDFVHFNFFIF